MTDAAARKCTVEFEIEPTVPEFSERVVAPAVDRPWAGDVSSSFVWKSIRTILRTNQWII